MWDAIYECKVCGARFTHKTYEKAEDGINDLLTGLVFHKCDRYGKKWIGRAEFVGLAYSEGKDEQNDKAET